MYLLSMRLGAKAAVWALAGALAGCGPPGGGPVPDARAPGELARPGAAAGHNVVLITIDTLRADHLGCYGFAGARTPNMDALAHDGLRFEQAVSAVPITLPSHTTIMTGLDPPHHGVRQNGTFRLEEGHRTLAETLRANGYATGAVVGAFVLDARYGLNRGFDDYDDRIVPERGTVAARFHARRADAVTAAATAWIDRHAAKGGGPFFLWVHYYDPHVPYDPPAEYAAAAGNPYDGEIAFVDAQLGALIRLLGERGLSERTLVVLTSDHGEGLGDHGEPTHMDLLYDSTMRVPMIFSNPFLFGRDAVARDRVAGLVDLFPTILGLLGIGSGGVPLDGRDVMRPQEPGREVYLETLAPFLDYGWSPLHAIRRVDDKLIAAPSPEYFDLKNDPGELRNAYATDPRAAELHGRLTRRLEELPADETARDEGRALDEEARARLQSLGYVRGPAPSGGGVNPEQRIRVGARIDQAVELGRSGRGADAVREIEAVLREYPRAARALVAATEIYDRLEQYDRGEAALARALAEQPTSDGWVHLAWYAFQRSDFVTFESALAQAERLDPGDGGIYLSRGHREMAEGRLDRALALFRKALEVDPVRSGDEAREAIAALEAELARRAASGSGR